MKCNRSLGARLLLYNLYDDAITFARLLFLETHCTIITRPTMVYRSNKEVICPLFYYFFFLGRSVVIDFNNRFIMANAPSGNIATRLQLWSTCFVFGCFE